MQYSLNISSPCPFQFILDAFPTSLFKIMPSFLFILQPQNLVSGTHTKMSVGHPLQHVQPIRDIFQEETDST